MNYPENPTAYLEQEVLKNARYLVVIVNQQGLVDRLECPGIEWSVVDLSIGRRLPDVLQAIADVCDDSTSAQLFSYVQLTDQVYVDVHILNREGEKQIILQDVSVGHEGTHRFQQKAHEVSLLLEKQAELNRLLEVKRAEADEASKAKSRFIANMSHEFKSPISSIMAHAEALHSEDSVAREPAAIRRASWYLLTLVENLLEQARPEDEERHLDISSIDVPALLNDMQELFGIQASSRGLTLEIEQSDGTALVQADDLRLRQVLVNLLSNAIRNTHEGGIRLLCRRRENVVEFNVTDTGSGIDEEDLERIFRPFTRIKSSSAGGAGLGLTISRQLVAAMHGELRVKSQAGEGSTFSFTLPIPEGDQPESSESLVGLSVLLVEGDVDVREMYSIWLEDWGVKGRAVSGCDLAMAEFKNEPADVVMTDLFLEDGNGVELLTSIREAQPGVATVLCSGSDAIETFFGDDRTVADIFVSKPVSAKRLETALRKAMRRVKNT